MARLSDNYYLRKCYLEREQVPTQSVMMKKMSPPLAKVYFKSMNRKLKVLAGLEPPMKGGGSDWYMPPKEVLDGRLVMQPIKNEHLTKLGYNGITLFGEQVVTAHHKQMEEEVNKALQESDLNWKKSIEASCKKEWEEVSKEAAKANTLAIQHAFQEFTTMYTSSICNIESLLLDAAMKEIQAMREEAFEKMKTHYQLLLSSQARMLYDRYTKKLNKEKATLKGNFVKQIEEANTLKGNQIHDINVEKHVVVEKLRQLLESINLACQVYVALKEREECEKEMDLSKREHKKTVKLLKEQIAMKDFEINLALEKEKKREEFNAIWKKKICAVVKKFQMFASYCLNELPEQADFFIDIEKLMMIQLSEALENPGAESIFVPDETFHTPVPKPHPFYLFCDKAHKLQVDQDLCPKHCTSSASHMPVVVVNKRCIYAACDNFEKFTDKVTEFIHGSRGNDIDFRDNRVYENYLPVKVTSSQQLLELKLESSIMQILQEELPNARKLPIECCECRVPFCFCSPLHTSRLELNRGDKTSKTPSIQTISSGNKIETRSKELLHEREPKWHSYMGYVIPEKCKCGKRAKKNLKEHLPPYMRNMSMYEETSLPNYEMCSVATLQRLVRKAQGKRPPPSPPKAVASKTRDVCTQYEDLEFNFLCTCFSDEEVTKLIKELMRDASVTDALQFKVLGEDFTSEYLSEEPGPFATECARSLRILLEDSPHLEEIFKKKDCTFES